VKHNRIKRFLRQQYFYFLDRLWRLATDDAGPLEMEKENQRLECYIEDLKGRIDYLKGA